MTDINPTTVPNLALAAFLSLENHTQNLAINEPLVLDDDFTIYTVANYVAGADWSAFGGRKSKLNIGAVAGYASFTLNGLVKMSGGTLPSGLVLLRVTRTGDQVSLQATGGVTLNAPLGVQIGKIDNIGASPLTPVLNSDPAIRQIANVVIERAIVLGSPEDVEISALLQLRTGAVL